MAGEIVDYLQEHNITISMGQQEKIGHIIWSHEGQRWSDAWGQWVPSKVTKKMPIVLSSARWGYELYCAEHAPDHDTERVSRDDLERIKAGGLGCFLCPDTPVSRSVLLPTEEELEDER